MSRIARGANDRSSEGGRGNRGEHGLTIIAGGTRIVGELVADGVIKVEGVVEGTVRADGEVLVTKEGAVEGDIHTREAIIGGRVQGSIFGSERVELQPGSVVVGDIATKRLVVQDGGELNGRVRMGEVDALNQPAPSPHPALSAG
jgi:cytoskeletal protein CcmA (bactofilin family)